MLPPKKQSLDERINDLKEYAEEEKESFSLESATLLRDFISQPFVIDKRPAVGLVDNGNLRALWIRDRGSQIGIQFLPEGIAQYVILYPGRRTKKSEGGNHTNLLQCLGTIDVEDGNKLHSILEGLELNYLWE